jgi:hypothetical protein
MVRRRSADPVTGSSSQTRFSPVRERSRDTGEDLLRRAGLGTASALPLSAGLLCELLLPDDLTKPGHVTGDQLKGHGRPGRRRRRRRRPAPSGCSRPGHGGIVPTGPGRHTAAGPHSCSGCPALAGGRDAARLPGIRSPGTVTMAWSAASSIRSRRSISSPRYKTSDASSAVWRGRILAQNAARLRMSARRLLPAARVATWGCPGT